MQSKLPIAVLCGFLLMALAACGGGDDGARITELETDLATSEEALERETEARETAERETAEAKKRADDAEDETADAKQRADAAEEETADAEEEIADAEEEIADAKEAQQTAEQGQRQAQQQQQQLQQQLTEAEQAELRARAESFGAQLGSPDPGSADVLWKRGNNLTFRPQGVVMTPGSAAPSVLGGWRSASFTGQSGTATSLVDETVYLYTNIQAPGTRAFWKKYGGTDLNVTQTEVTSGLAKPSTSVSRTRTDLNNPNSAFASATTGGTYDGVSGKFSCTGDDSACTVTRTDGTTSIGTTNWTFKATNLNSGAPVDQDDAFLYFGIWSSIPDNISEDAYNFRYVAGGGAATGSDLSDFNTLTGSATFGGGAVGKYVTQGQVGGQNAKIGTFTATATLNADFGDGDESGDLSGSITEFREDGSPLAGWRVTLGGATDVGDASDIGNGAVTGGITVANIGGLSVGGSWGATFHGSTNDITGLADRKKYPAVDLAGVAGWFDATGPDASLAGAFAATPSN